MWMVHGIQNPRKSQYELVLSNESITFNWNNTEIKFKVFVMVSNFPNPCYLVLFLDLFLNSICIWRHGGLGRLMFNFEFGSCNNWRVAFLKVVSDNILLLKIDIIKMPSWPLQRTSRKCCGNLSTTSNWQSSIQTLTLSGSLRQFSTLGCKSFGWWLIFSFFFCVFKFWTFILFWSP